MIIAAGQFSAGSDPGENTTAARRLIAAAAAAGAQLVVLPESSLYGTSEAAGAIAAVAEDLDGPFIRNIAAFAKEHAIAVLVGTYERTDAGLPYNTLVALDRRGDVLGCYRKVHLLAANQTGPLATGFSMAVDPAGVVVANAGEEPGLIVARLSRGRLARVRAQVPVLENRRYAVVPSPDVTR
ncbi:hypothetical protein J7I84_02320 [Arthrobacter sp. ISL-85]|nr:hypothetical protein [Arthrobacter sp. ISL-85]